MDYFSYSVSPDFVGFLFIIETTIPEGDLLSDTYIRLIGTDGATELAADDDAGTGNASKILHAITAPGLYYVEVSQAFTTDAGTYSLSVLRAGVAPDDDHGDDAQSSTPLVVSDPPATGSSDVPGDEDFFHFVAQPGWFYDIETSALGTGSDTVITLYESDGETVIGSDDQTGREFNASRIQWFAPEDLVESEDVKFVKVVQFLPSAQGDYSLSVTSPGKPAELVFDPTATNQGDLVVAGDAEAYVYTATHDHRIEVNLATTNETNDFELRLIDTDGITEQLEQDDLEFEDLVYVHSETGAYYLLVSEPYVGGAYSLSATMEAPAPQPDVNGDGKVDVEDILHILEHYQTGP